MKFNHDQLKEIYSAVKNGEWRDQEIKEELIKILENYFIDYVLQETKVETQEGEFLPNFHD